MKKKLIISTLFVAIVAIVAVGNFSKVSQSSSNIDLAGLITLNAANAEVSSEGCKYKVSHACWADDGNVFGDCQERVLFNGTCNP